MKTKFGCHWPLSMLYFGLSLKGDMILDHTGVLCPSDVNQNKQTQK